MDYQNNWEVFLWPCGLHDGAPSHYTRLVMQRLSDIFLNWCAYHGSTVNWPPGSPDLTPLDFCLWGWMKSKIYRRKLDTWDELLDHVMDVIACIKERQDALTCQTSNTPCPHTSCKVHWCWRRNYWKCITLGKLYQRCHLNNEYRY
jgi:hypothetical protein